MPIELKVEFSEISLIRDISAKLQREFQMDLEKSRRIAQEYYNKIVREGESTLYDALIEHAANSYRKTKRL